VQTTPNPLATSRIACSHTHVLQYPLRITSPLTLTWHMQIVPLRIYSAPSSVEVDVNQWRQLSGQFIHIIIHQPHPVRCPLPSNPREAISRSPPRRRSFGRHLINSNLSKICGRLIRSHMHRELHTSQIDHHVRDPNSPLMGWHFDNCNISKNVQAWVIVHDSHLYTIAFVTSLSQGGKMPSFSGGPPFAPQGPARIISLSPSYPRPSFPSSGTPTLPGPTNASSQSAQCSARATSVGVSSVENVFKPARGGGSPRNTCQERGRVLVPLSSPHHARNRHVLAPRWAEPTGLPALLGTNPVAEDAAPLPTIHSPNNPHHCRDTSRST
jgi:hypothetical protein